MVNYYPTVVNYYPVVVNAYPTVVSHAQLIVSTFSDNAKVFILNPNHCGECVEFVKKLGALLMMTGRIRCVIDMFVPMADKIQGPALWTQEMILKCDYVIIPWICEISSSRESKYI